MSGIVKRNITYFIPCRRLRSWEPFPGVVRDLRERLAEWKSNQTDQVISGRGEVELSDGRIEKLKTLGYLQ